MGNVQTPLLQFPHVYFYTSCIWDLDYRKRSEKDVLLDLAAQLYPEHQTADRRLLPGSEGDGSGRDQHVGPPTRSRSSRARQAGSAGGLGTQAVSRSPHRRQVAGPATAAGRRSRVPGADGARPHGSRAVCAAADRLRRRLSRLGHGARLACALGLGALAAGRLSRPIRGFRRWLASLSKSPGQPGGRRRLFCRGGRVARAASTTSGPSRTAASRRSRTRSSPPCPIESLAQQAKATASVSPNPERYPASAANDGVLSTLYWPGALVENNTQWLQLTWDAPQTFDRVDRALPAASFHARPDHPFAAGNRRRHVGGFRHDRDSRRRRRSPCRGDVSAAVAA